MKDNIICYCFKFTKSDIEKDILTNNRSTIEDRIKAEKKVGACECTTKNPSRR